MSDIHFTGGPELNAFMQSLPVKIEKNILRGALRAGANIVKPVAQQNVHSISGLLAAGLKVSTRAKAGIVTASLKATGKHWYIAKWIEFGTARHPIPAAPGGSLFFGGIFTKFVMHPGARKKAFMRPALDQQASAAVVAAAEYMKARLATKESLDTAGIDIGAES